MCRVGLLRPQEPVEGSHTGHRSHWPQPDQRQTRPDCRTHHAHTRVPSQPPSVADDVEDFLTDPPTPLASLLSLSLTHALTLWHFSGHRSASSSLINQSSLDHAHAALLFPTRLPPYRALHTVLWLSIILNCPSLSLHSAPSLLLCLPPGPRIIINHLLCTSRGSTADRRPRCFCPPAAPLVPPSSP